MAVTTLGSIIVGIGVPTRDNLFGKTTQASAVKNQFVDTKFITQTDDIYVSSEVLWTDYIDETGNNPHIFVPTDRSPNTPGPDVIIDSQGSTGIFTLRQDWNNANGVPQDFSYVMMNIRGRGIPYDYRLAAARYAIESMADKGIVREYDAGAGVAQTRSFTIPGGTLDTVFDVRLRSLVDAGTYFDTSIAPRSWHLRPNRVVEVSARQVESTNARVIIVGRVYPQWSDDLNTTIPVARDVVVRGALEWMSLYPRGAREAAAHSSLMQDRMRNQSEYWFPNEERIY